MAHSHSIAVKMSSEEKEMFLTELGIRIDGELGKGVYGYVYQATFVDVEIMIKRPVVKEVEVHLPSTSSASASTSRGQQDWISEHKPINGQKVAIKWLVYKDEVTADKVKIESRILDVMQHPNIVTILTAMWLQWDKLAIVMELSSIGHINKYIQEVGHGLTYPFMNLRQYRKFASGLVSAIVAMHKIGYTHRDLHPGNILIFPDEDPRQFQQGQVIAKLCDFGQAFHLKLTKEDGERIEGKARWEIIDKMEKGMEYDKRRIREILRQVITHGVQRRQQGHEAERVYRDATKEFNYELDDLEYYKQEKKKGLPKKTEVVGGVAETGV